MSLQIGDTASLSKKITDRDIRAFAELTGDYNLAHLDEDFAQNTKFGRRVAHGMLSASLISAVIGTKLPGGKIASLGNTARFLAPVYVDDTVTARVTVQGIRADKPVITLSTVCENQRGERVVEGEAVVLLL